MNRLTVIAACLISIFMLSGCEGILDNIYDDAPTDSSFSEGFHPGLQDNEMLLQLDATSYDEWIYIDLHDRRIERMGIPRGLSGEWDGQSGITYQLVEGTLFTPLSHTQTDAQPEPTNWDLAIHHFDVKTNGGMAAVEGDNNFTPDILTDNQVIVDMREMMGYKIGYQRSYINPVLTTWVTMDFSTPPPTYSASGDTYILRLADGTHARLKLRSYTSERGTKGFLSIDITYPL